MDQVYKLNIMFFGNRFEIRKGKFCPNEMSRQVMLYERSIRKV